MIKFSIFLPVLNGMPKVKSCIESILNQSYQNFQLIILCNKNSDYTEQFLKNNFLDNNKITIIYSNNLIPIEENFERILNCDMNDYLTVVGHDDILMNNFLIEAKNLIDKNPDHFLFQLSGSYVDEKKKIIKQLKLKDKKIEIEDYLKSRFDKLENTSGTGYVIKSDEFKKIGGFPKLKNLAFSDDILWLKLIMKKGKITSSSNCYNIAIRSNSISSSLNINNISNQWQNEILSLMRFKEYLCNSDLLKKRLIKKKNRFFDYYFAKIFILYILSCCFKNEKTKKTDLDYIYSEIDKINFLSSKKIKNSFFIKMSLKLINFNIFRKLLKFIYGFF